jgi:alpha-mannosidase
MHDEASPLWVAMVDQTTRGHQFIVKNFGKEKTPRGTWQVRKALIFRIQPTSSFESNSQIDPFGHSNTESWLLGAEAGMESLFWGRTDYQDLNKRYNESGYEWIWQGSQSLGKSAQTFAGSLHGSGHGGYSTWINFDGNGDQVQDDPVRHDYNVDQWVDKFVQDATKQGAHTKTEHQLWACGTDFQYQNADHWYTNLDKLIHYVNLNGTVNAFYSTPSFYVDQKKKDTTVQWEVRQDDIFPLADNAHHYWTGYFTSRPALKRQVRFATNFLQSARQLEVVTKLTKEQVGDPTVRFSPPVGESWTDSLEGTIGVATHHDGMSGTERQDVSDDYEQRISESYGQVETGVSMAIKKLLNLPASASVDHCSCNAADNCLNISVCAATTGKDAFSVVAYNPQGHNVSQTVRIPVTDASYTVTGPAGAVTAQVVELDARTLSLPLLYLNSFKMKPVEIAKAKAALANKATHVLTFQIETPAVGYSVYAAKKSSIEQCATSGNCATQPSGSYDEPAALALKAENDMYALNFDNSTGLVSSITNKISGITTPFAIEWGWYNSSVGGCTKDLPPALAEKACDGQRSGAYIFRPNSSTIFFPGATAKPTISVVTGPVVTEIYQKFSNWATHVIRLYKGQPYIEVEWTAGPIPIDTPWFPPVAHDKKGKAMPNNWGKEVIVKYTSGIKSAGNWYTDSNGKEMVKRMYNKRGPSYPAPYNISEPVAGNYYPVNAMMSLDDGKNELAILTDVSQGGASLADGSLEFMVHRRVLADDARGVQEPLNETMCGCNDINAAPGKMGKNGHLGDGGCECAGLTMRGRHWIIFDTIEKAHESRRVLSEGINFPAALTFTTAPTTSATALSAAMPAGVKLVTLTNNYAKINDGALLLRISHMYQVNEHPTLAKPITFSLSGVFGKTGLKIISITETSLTANQGIAEMDAKKFNWPTKPANDLVAAQLAENVPYDTRFPFDNTTDDLSITIRPMEVRTFLAIFE